MCIWKGKESGSILLTITKAPRFEQCAICVQRCVKSVFPSCGFALPCTDTHAQTHAQRNESCWKEELRSIRLTTYLQTVGKSCLSVTHQREEHTHFALLTPGLCLSQLAQRQRGMYGWMYRGVKEGDDGVWTEWKIHKRLLYNHKNKPICLNTNIKANGAQLSSCGEVLENQNLCTCSHMLGLCSVHLVWLTALFDNVNLLMTIILYCCGHKSVVLKYYNHTLGLELSYTPSFDLWHNLNQIKSDNLDLSDHFIRFTCVVQLPALQPNHSRGYKQVEPMCQSNCSYQVLMSQGTISLWWIICQSANTGANRVNKQELSLMSEPRRELNTCSKLNLSTNKDKKTKVLRRSN